MLWQEHGPSSFMNENRANRSIRFTKVVVDQIANQIRVCFAHVDSYSIRENKI